MSALKTVKQEESIARSRFADCPVCKNHSLKLKRTVQVGRCKSCNETYKIIIVYVKTGRKAKGPGVTPVARPTLKVEGRPESVPESSLPSGQQPSHSSLFGPSTEPYSGLSEAIFGRSDKQEGSGTGSSAGQ